MNITRMLVGALTTLALVFGSATLAAAPWKPVTDAELIATSELIVVGKIVWIENGPVAADSVDKAKILVQEVLKGDPSAVLATLTFPGRNRGRVAWNGSFESTRGTLDIFFELNQEGIWFLRRGTAQGEFVIDHPGRFRPLFFKGKVVAALGQQ